MKKKYHYIVDALILILLAVVVIGFRFIPGMEHYSSPQYLRELIINSGNWGYLIFALLMILTIPLPIPSTTVVLSGGYVYGVIGGTFLALIAGAVGGSLAFWLVRRYGRPLVERLVEPEHLDHLDQMFQKKGPVAALISYAVPLFPSDSISLALGLTKMTWRTFWFVWILGHIPRYLILTSLGEDLYGGFTVKTVIVLIVGLLLILATLFKDRIKTLILKEWAILGKKASWLFHRK